MVVDPYGFPRLQGRQPRAGHGGTARRAAPLGHRAPHAQLLEAVRKRDHRILTADIEIGAAAAAFCHLANIAYRLRRRLRIDPETERFIGDEEANRMLTREYRHPYAVPEIV